ncbi:MAG: lysophospholipid acyltransferase family protein [Ignavibacteria bacterium]|jgi:lysophospholipid acyltransferase (LPLAT)-like uncharacterized protein
MKLKEIKRNTLRFIGNKFLYYITALLCKTLKVIKINEEAVAGLEKQNKNYVFAFWHGKMLMPWYINRKKNFSALVSRSKDGDILANLLKKWKYDVSRGSSHAGGKEALDEILTKANSKKCVAITPDGPTGPIYKMKAGAVITAKKTQIPIIMVGVYNGKKYVLKSWDKFEIPKLFSKSVLVFSDPIYVDDNLSYNETTLKIDECESTLMELEKEAQKYC